jgi:hypothetical protein
VKWGQEDFQDREGFQVFQAHLGYLEQKVAKEQREMKGQMDLQVHLAKLVAKDLLDHQVLWVFWVLQGNLDPEANLDFLDCQDQMALQVTLDCLVLQEPKDILDLMDMLVR